MKFRLTYTDATRETLVPSAAYHDGSMDASGAVLLTYIDISTVEELTALCRQVQEADRHNVSGLVVALLLEEDDGPRHGVEFKIEVYNDYRE